MLSSSDSEEFYDAEGADLVESGQKLSVEPSGLNVDVAHENQLPQTRNDNVPDIEKTTVKPKRSTDQESWRHNLSSPSKEEIKEAERKARDNERRRRRVEEQRRKLFTEDDDTELPASGQSSRTSSLDGFYPSAGKQLTHRVPAKQEDDESSVISLGNVGSLLGDNFSLDSRNSITQVTYPEPDLVASTKCSSDVPVSVPVRPPRKNRKPRKAPNSLDVHETAENEPPVPAELLTPTSAIESIENELEFSLDLHSAIKGKYVVKPQDFEKNRAPPRELETETQPPVLGLSSSSLNGSELFVVQPSSLGLPPKSGVGESLSRSSRGSSRSSSLQEDSICQMNIMMRTRSDSGRPLTDLEILEQVTVLNLDTGEQIPLSKAEDHLPKGINPLSLHLMRLTSEYVSNSRLDKNKGSDDDGSDTKKSVDGMDNSSHRSKRSKLKGILERTVNKIKTVADDVYHAKHSEDIESSDEETPGDLKFKASSSHKGPYEFDNIRVVQDLVEHTGAIWTMKFSVCGRMLATAGQDHQIRIWVLKDAFSYFDDMRQKYNAEAAKVSPTPSQESLASQHNSEEQRKMHQQESEKTEAESSGDNSKGPFMSRPICTYEGHTADVLDLSWSKNYFILSSSMDKTVRLWHISRRECLCCFQHNEFVTAIAFHPRDDRYFLSGSLDGRLRLWNIPDKKVAVWNEVEGQSKFITAVNFCQNGRFAVIGSYDGRCVFYITEQLKYHTQIHVRSSRGKNAKGRKISGIEPLPGEDKILIASNDSRIRLYDRNQSLVCKYKGYVNQSSQNKASFSSDGKYIISGSENHLVYIWKTQHDISKFSSARRDLNQYWEGIKAHNAVVTAAIFAPFPSLILSNLDQTENTSSSMSQVSSSGSYVFVSADFNGCIKVFAKKKKMKTNTLPTGLSC